MEKMSINGLTLFFDAAEEQETVELIRQASKTFQGQGADWNAKPSQEVIM